MNTEAAQAIKRLKLRPGMSAREVALALLNETENRSVKRDLVIEVLLALRQTGDSKQDSNERYNINTRLSQMFEAVTIDGVRCITLDGVKRRPQVTKKPQAPRHGLDLPLGRRTNDHFFGLPILEDNGNPLAPRGALEYFPSRLEGSNLTDLEYVAGLVGRNKPVLLVGDQSTGKNAMLRFMAEQCRHPLVRIPMHDMPVEDVIGGTRTDPEAASGFAWVDGLLTAAVRNGYWAVLDEINQMKSELLTFLHPLTDDERKLIIPELSEVITPHPDFRLFATMNPPESGLYNGLQLNAATKQRFRVVQMSYPNAATEVEILVTRTNVDRTLAAQVVQMANELRKVARRLRFPVGTRDLIDLCDDVANGVPTYAAALLNIVNKAPLGQQAAVRDIVNLHLATEPLGPTNETVSVGAYR